jgi:hypothetical protein
LARRKKSDSSSSGDTAASARGGSGSKATAAPRRKRTRKAATKGSKQSSSQAIAAQSARRSRAKSPASESAEQEAVTPAARRTHEVFGIITLACALLIGPSLITVQFGSGQLMGPFGQTVGGVLTWALGLTAYLLVAVLLVTAIRIFAAAIGRSRPPEATATMWRRRIGLVLAALFGAILLHLIARPARLADASYGGTLGETLAELFTAVLSSAGSWIIAVAGMALALVLATDFSWVRAWLRLWLATERGVEGAGDKVSRLALKERFAAAGQWLGQQLRQVERRRQIATDHNGAAALPPVVRLDLADHLLDDDEQASGSGSKRSRRETPDEGFDPAEETPVEPTPANTDETVDATELVIHSRSLDDLTAEHQAKGQKAKRPAATKASQAGASEPELPAAMLSAALGEATTDDGAGKTASAGRRADRCRCARGRQQADRRRLPRVAAPRR